jgi:flagellar motor switch protein FliN/FliY
LKHRRTGLAGNVLQASGEDKAMHEGSQAMTDGNELGMNEGAAPNFGTILSIPVTVQVVLGSASMPVANLMKLGRGAVIPLDQRVGDPVNIVVNGRVVARGEVVVYDDDNTRFGVSLIEVPVASNADRKA